MALLELKNVTRRFGKPGSGEGCLAFHRGRRVLHPARPLGLRQDHHPAHDRRLRRAGRRRHPARRRSLAGVPPEKRPLHTVFQSYALFPHMTVAGNVAFPLEMAGCTADDIRRRVGETLELGASRRQGRQLSARDFGRPEAACRAGAQPGQPAAPAAARRVARRARRQAARADADRTDRPAARRSASPSSSSPTPRTKRWRSRIASR